MPEICKFLQRTCLNQSHADIKDWKTSVTVENVCTDTEFIGMRKSKKDCTQCLKASCMRDSQSCDKVKDRLPSTPTKVELTPVYKQTCQKGHEISLPRGGDWGFGTSRRVWGWNAKNISEELAESYAKCGAETLYTCVRLKECIKSPQKAGTSVKNYKRTIRKLLETKAKQRSMWLYQDKPMR